MDALVILTSPDADAGRERIARELRISQIASPRMFVVQGDSEAIQRLTASGAVRAVDADISDLALSTSESLFARAWTKGIGLRDKKRSGDGLSWDAEGFEPP